MLTFFQIQLEELPTNQRQANAEEPTDFPPADFLSLPNKNRAATNLATYKDLAPFPPPQIYLNGKH